MLFSLYPLVLSSFSPPHALSFSSNLLSPRDEAEALIACLRRSGVGHVAAVGDCEGVAALLECGAIDQLLRTNSNHEPIASSEVERAAALDEWVHICDTVPRLAGAKRMGARTIWLNQQAAADENSRGFTGEPGESSSYLARGVIADLADGVCGELAEIPATLEQVQ